MRAPAVEMKPSTRTGFRRDAAPSMTPAIPPGEEEERTMKKFPVEVWDVVDKEDGLGPQRTLLHDRAPDHVEAEGFVGDLEAAQVALDEADDLVLHDEHGQ